MSNKIEKVVEVKVVADNSGELKKLNNDLNKLDKSFDSSTKNVKKFDEANVKSRKGVLENGGAMGLLGAATGGLAMDFKDAVEAIELTGVSLKGLRGAIIATGIGALAIVVLELVTNWDKWIGVIDGSTAAMDKLNNSIEDYKNFQETMSIGNEENIAQQEEFIKLRKAQGASIEELTKLENSLSEQRYQATELALYGIEGQKKGLFDLRTEALLTQRSFSEGSKKYEEMQVKINDINKQINEQTKIRSASKNEPAIRAAENEAAALEKLRQKREQASKERENQLKALENFENKMLTDIANLNAKSEADKLKILKDGEQKQLDAIKLSNAEKVKAQELLNEKYKLLAIKGEEDRAKAAKAIIEKYEREIAELRDKSGKTALINKEADELKILQDSYDKKLLNAEEFEKAKILLAEKYAEIAAQKERERQTKVDDIVNEYTDKKKELEIENEEDQNKKAELKYELEIEQQEEEEAKKLKELEDLKASEDEKKAITDYYDALAIQSQKTRDEIVAANKEAQLQSNLENLSAILSIGGKKFEKIQKALAIAEVVRDTIRSVNAATGNEIKVPAFIGTIPNPVKPASVVSTILGIGGAIAKGAASIAAITSGSKSVSGGGNSPGDGGGGAPVTPQANFNIVGQSNTNLLADTIANRQQQPVEAFVVGNSVTKQQELDRNKIANSTFL